MAIDFKVPDLGENVDSGDIVNVMVKEGDEIQAEQSVMEIETGKAVVELPCPYAGRITKIYVQKGSKVKVGDPLLTVDGAGAAPAAKSQPRNAKAEPAPVADQPAAEPAAEQDQRQVASKQAADVAAQGQASGQSRACRQAPSGRFRKTHGREDAFGKNSRPPGRPRAAWRASWASTWR